MAVFLSVMPTATRRQRWTPRPAAISSVSTAAAKVGPSVSRPALAMATPTSTTTSWQAYQLLAGSSDALPSLLQLSCRSEVPREQIFDALASEYRLHCERRGNPASELELLWKLLAQVGDDIARLLVDAAVVGDRDFEIVDALPAHGGVDEEANFAALVL